MLLGGRIIPGARFPEVSFPQILAHTDCVLEARTFEKPLAMDLFFFPNFLRFHVPLENLTGFPLFRRIDFFSGSVSWTLPFQKDFLPWGQYFFEGFLPSAWFVTLERKWNKMVQLWATDRCRK